MDAVITYVNMNDPIWRTSYKKTFDDEPNVNRFKELGTIHLQIDCIRKFMPWIENIYVVVSNKEQLITDKATVITHDQIIPKEYLPTFNSCTIEMFLHRIPNLSQYFIYFNDDMIPINFLSEKEFFKTKPILSFKIVIEPPQNIYRFQCKNSTNLARTIVGLPLRSDYIKTDHICCVHSKEAYEKIWSLAGKTILNSLTKKRDKRNFNQYLFADYLFYSNQCLIKRLNYKFLEYKTFKPIEIYNIITSQQYDLICLQDNVDDEQYNRLIIKALKEIL